MTNNNKMNSTQKNALADFMREHPNLAKNLLPNCAQGKATSTRLWLELSNKLNAVGPPVKNPRMWPSLTKNTRLRKKLSYNNQSKKKTGGGPYTKKLITQAEEYIIEASGLEMAVEGLRKVTTFGNNSESKNISDIEYLLSGNEMEEENYTERQLPTGTELTTEMSTNRSQKSTNKVCESKIVLLKENIKLSGEMQKDISEKKLDVLLMLKERSLKMKEEDHVINMEIKKIELEIKSIELENLKK